MAKPNDGGTAFPYSKPYYEPEDYRIHRGMSRRDYFAAAALTGIIASHTGIQAMPDEDEAASDARAYADALIAELDKEVDNAENS